MKNGIDDDMNSVMNRISNELITKEKALLVICGILNEFKIKPNDELARNLVDGIIYIDPSLTKDECAELI